MQPKMELKVLPNENVRLKKMVVVAEQALDMEILKQSTRRNW